ncbi:uncharacterized protein LOC110622916 isoform X3 [Manihot esculenta]|uniref:Uncharacterized protein n=1 Tax=Manihot esculenta TaxID=3983 RepID=A0ACB7H2S3_MANES|nr:uncharacterized protein LOC110622916 isoform X3 [Manihot esculenta]XP_043815960.1 uncharacterized protein LOC110622916 isoform X3 [Manihot esculenta]KAG8646471.1 hypothetical protein MANES_09G010000v8 [Manihot esculenta]
MRTKCRIWWPKYLASSELSSSHFLFGWFISCSSASIDIVVAFTCNDVSFFHWQSGIKEILCDTNENMPILLQEKSMFSLLGQGAAYLGGDGKLLNVGLEEDNWRKPSKNSILSTANRQDVFIENYGGRSCTCHKIDELVEQSCEASAEGSCWINLVYDSGEQYGRDICWLPKLHHIHWNGQVVPQFNVHVIVYETPVYGMHHFSLSSWISSEQVKGPLKKPEWVDELDRSQPLFDLDTIILAINSAAAAKAVIEKRMNSKRSYAGFSIIHVCLAFMWHVLAISVASISTLFYITIQLLYRFSSFGSKTQVFISLAGIFSTTWTNSRIRFCQILYWPIFLQDNGLRYRSCVEYAEKAALLRHSMWSSFAVDLLFGNLLGLLLLYNADSACLWVSTFASDITNELLRSGCVWLMGVPAGFKLNTELAGVLGMVSLNVIQIWSTLWIFVGFLFIYFIKGLALLGILFGATILAALIIDMVALATLHVSSLHFAMSLLYSQQIQALAALWRLFRGRKWNPLRQRLDSYNYTVKQHVVGSLLFTPLLLLLPTTSVFYIFFTILNTAITFICVLIEITISMIHGTPYIKILLRLLRQRRFPSGIWFEIVSCHGSYQEFSCLHGVGSSSENSQQKDAGKERSGFLVSILHSNFLNIDIYHRTSSLASLQEDFLWGFWFRHHISLWSSYR